MSKSEKQQQALINQLSPENAKALINAGLKQNMLPNYFQTVKGVENPRNIGLNPNGLFDPFITNNGNKYQVKRGYTTHGSYTTLEEAKVAKKDLLPIHFNQVKKNISDDYKKTEANAKSIINKKHGRNAFQNLPIKSQFVIQDYIRTGNKNEDLFDGIVANDFNSVIEKYQRPDLGKGSELFREVMFSGPVGENGFANLDQAKNYAKAFINKVNPAMSVEYSAMVDENSSSFIAEEQEPSVMQEAQQSFDKGGMANIQAEFTGNELVNNKESEMREALDKGENKKAAKIFKEEAENPKNITPGEASHSTNPLPVAEDGTVMDKDGNDTGLDAKPGAGVYDHIDKQYKPGMSSKEVISMITKNHKKWKKNNMD